MKDVRDSRSKSRTSRQNSVTIPTKNCVSIWRTVVGRPMKNWFSLDNLPNQQKCKVGLRLDPFATKATPHRHSAEHRANLPLSPIRGLHAGHPKGTFAELVAFDLSESCSIFEPFISTFGQFPNR